MLRGVSVDREVGCIRRVPVITAGVTKPSGGGHGSFDVDAVTLQQVADAINGVARVRSRVTHPEVEGVDGIDRRVGYFVNATVENGKVYADFHFGSYATDNHKTMLCGLVEEEPEDIGVSIVSETASIEPAQNTQTGMVLRLSQLDAIDWTDDPAANPAGMLSAVKLKGLPTMFTEEQLSFLRGVGLPEDAPAESIPAFIDGLTDEQKAAFNAIAGAPSEPVEPPTELNEEEKPVAATEDEEKPVSASEDEEKKPAAMSAKDFDQAVGVALAKERSRVKEINAVALKCGYDRKWVDSHIDKNTPIDEVRRVALAGLKRSPDDMQTTKTTVIRDNNRDTLFEAVQDAIMLRSGRRNLYKHDDEGGVMLSATGAPESKTAHERSREFRGLSLTEMARKYFLALGCRKVETMNKVQLATFMMSRGEIAAAMPGVYLAHSTGDFPYILADSMGKVLRQEYKLAPHTWERWARRGTAPDFKEIKKIQLSEASDLAVVPEGDEIEYGTLTEGREVYALKTYAKGLKFTRQMLINDDLSAFDRVPRMMGRAAARNVEQVAIAILTANADLADGEALFSTAHGNLSTGALTVTSLGTAKNKLMTQTALGSDDPLELTPSVLLVPSAIETVARQLISSTVDPAKNNATPNPFANAVEVVPSARLDSDSTTQWYLFADNNEIDTVEVGFLEGAETPVIEEEDEFDSKVRKVSIMHDVAAKAIDYRGIVRSSGS
jgi:hypothetical protein